MPDPDLLTVFQAINSRRRELRMSYGVLAKRSGVSLPTVVRILSGRYLRANFSSVCAVAGAVGLGLGVAPEVSVGQLLQRAAESKARRLVGLVQGTSALEGQGLDAQTLEKMTRRTVKELLTGPRTRLWG